LPAQSSIGFGLSEKIVRNGKRRLHIATFMVYPKNVNMNLLASYPLSDQEDKAPSRAK
jgi:hypothetical protein